MNKIIDEYTDLLETEYRLIQIGDVDGLMRLVDHKETLLGHLGSGTGLRQLRTLMARNQRALKGFMNGINYARHRMDEVRKAQGFLSLYNGQGHKNAHPTGHSRKFEQKL
jgi:hypothetical protein